jgi:tripartite-type tricarboxylate transporter receptor subunit TctC
MQFRLILVAAAVTMAVTMTVSVQAQQPLTGRPITMIVPFAAGGPADVLARILAQQMGPSLGGPIVVENVPGAGGTIGTARGAKAPPDGRTMIMGNVGTHGASVGLYKNLPYDPRTDFEPVMLVATIPMVLFAKKHLQVSSLQEFVTLAKSRTLSMGSAGTGSMSHLTLLLFAHLSGTDIKHVSGSDLPGGQFDALFDVVTASHAASGAAIPIVVTATERAPSLPRVPSAAEAGLPGLHTLAWTAVFLPKRTPERIVASVTAALEVAMRDDGVVESFSKLGADLPPPDQRSPKVLAGLVRAEVAKWTPLIRAAGLVPE